MKKIGKSLPNPKLPSNSFNTVGTQLTPTKFNLNKTTKNISLTGKQSVTAKKSKDKKAPDPFLPPSKFFEKSELSEPKHPSLRNLWNFLNNRSKSKKS